MLEVVVVRDYDIGEQLEEMMGSEKKFSRKIGANNEELACPWKSLMIVLMPDLRLGCCLRAWTLKSYHLDCNLV